MRGARCSNCQYEYEDVHKTLGRSRGLLHGLVGRAKTGRDRQPSLLFLLHLPTPAHRLATHSPPQQATCPSVTACPSASLSPPSPAARAPPPLTHEALQPSPHLLRNLPPRQASPKGSPGLLSPLLASRRLCSTLRRRGRGSRRRGEEGWSSPSLSDPFHSRRLTCTLLGPSNSSQVVPPRSQKARAALVEFE